MHCSRKTIGRLANIFGAKSNKWCYTVVKCANLFINPLLKKEWNLLLLEVPISLFRIAGFTWALILIGQNCRFLQRTQSHWSELQVSPGHTGLWISHHCHHQNDSPHAWGKDLYKFNLFWFNKVLGSLLFWHFTEWVQPIVWEYFKSSKSYDEHNYRSE